MFIYNFIHNRITKTIEQIVKPIKKLEIKSLEYFLLIVNAHSVMKRITQYTKNMQMSIKFAHQILNK